MITNDNEKYQKYLSLIFLQLLKKNSLHKQVWCYHYNDYHRM